ncbi:methyltransfer with N-terminal ankyrin repeats [Cryptosporidium ubiquitum]|uniref:Methyltransfer with N-terminal ankyrin repeats n=1 Tax=Cryptosporidium ubiquitum TaxID=857276 RepID=A0A1J4MQL3_9CRYT|nr:methyltransfer with N-terminal ankyrin repeats [Cryptosporidium ubiquitum]OII75181.1 methyltransfer with N-terminal ankyrin repeats [Cryptosporidium ubiquitum]
MEGLTIKEISDEMTECARYGELDDLKYILDNYKIDVDYQDDSGNTALHKSSANGHLDIVCELLRRKASINKQNNNGNSPLHWAVTNKKKEVVIKLLSDKRSVEEGGADVLLKNCLNKSVLTEVFNINDVDILKLALEHPSADRLEQEHSESVKFDEDHEEANGDSNATISQEFIHNLTFIGGNAEDLEAKPLIKCREIALMGIKKVFDQDPQNDTTGAHLWSSSIVASYWMVNLIRNENIFAGKRVLELGCGCGLMGLVAAIYSKYFFNSQPKKLFLTDVSRLSLENADVNIKLNSALLGEDHNFIQAKYLNWFDHESFRNLDSDNPEIRGTFDIILGSDLVYNFHMEIQLSQVISELLTHQGIFYYVHRHDRLCASKFKQSLEKTGFICQEISSPEEYTRNPLYGESQQVADSLFNELSSHSEFYLLTARRQ